MQKQIACVLALLFVAACGPAGAFVQGFAGAMAAGASRHLGSDIQPSESDDDADVAFSDGSGASRPLAAATDRGICDRATNIDGTWWTSELRYKDYVEEAKKRRLSPSKCRSLASRDGQS